MGPGRPVPGDEPWALPSPDALQPQDSRPLSPLATGLRQVCPSLSSLVCVYRGQPEPQTQVACQWRLDERSSHCPASGPTIVTYPSTHHSWGHVQPGPGWPRTGCLLHPKVSSRMPRPPSPSHQARPPLGPGCAAGDRHTGTMASWLHLGWELLAGNYWLHSPPNAGPGLAWPRAGARGMLWT